MTYEISLDDWKAMQKLLVLAFTIQIFLLVLVTGAHAQTAYQAAMQTYQQLQQSAQSQEQTLEQSAQQNFQTFQQSIQRYEQSIQGQQNTYQQAVNAKSLSGAQQSFLQYQQSIQQIEQASQQDQNQAQQTQQQIIQAAGQAIQQAEQQTVRDLNAGNFANASVDEAAISPLIQQETQNLQTALEQAQASFAQRQVQIQTALQSEAALSTPATTTAQSGTTPSTPATTTGQSGVASSTPVTTASPPGSVSSTPVTPAVSGTCGTANGMSLASAPSTGLCTTGTASQPSGSGPWTWTCTGTSGGSIAACSTKTATRSAFSFITASSYDAANGAALATFPPDIGYLNPGEWVKYSNIDFGSGTNLFHALVAVAASNAGQRIQVVLDSASNSAVGALTVASTGSYGTYQTQTTSISNVTGIHDVYLTFAGYGGVANLGGIQFDYQPPPTVQPPVTQPQAATAAFYVSPSGNDSNDGKSASAPFQTLEKAQAAMENSSSVKTTYLLGGLYNRAATLSLSNWNDGGQSWLAYPEQTPILDGGGRTTVGISIVATGVIVDGLTIRNFTQSGIYGKWCDNLIIQNNTVLGITTPDWRIGPPGGSIFVLHSKNDLITHNLVNGNTGEGIQVNGGGLGDIQSNDIVTYNIVFNTCTAVDDCGAIYFRDVGHQSVGEMIAYNIVANLPHSNTTAIYLDDEQSNTDVENNVVYGSMSVGFLIHGGNNNIFRNNIFDVSSVTSYLALYQDDVNSGGVNYGMAGNIFSKNIIYAAGKPINLWDFINQSGGTIALPTDSGNLYYAQGGAFANTGTIIDGNWVSKDPGFLNQSAGNYSLTTNVASAAIGFQSIDQTQIGPQ